MLADQVDPVIGVDTHCDAHELAVVAASSGGLVARSSQRANPRGCRKAICFAAAHAPGVRVWAIEGSGHYGASLLSLHGESVVDQALTPRRPALILPGAHGTGVRGRPDPEPAAHPRFD
jgi:transposase